MSASLASMTFGIASKSTSVPPYSTLNSITRSESASTTGAALGAGPGSEPDVHATIRRRIGATNSTTRRVIASMLRMEGRQPLGLVVDLAPGGAREALERPDQHATSFDTPGHRPTLAGEERLGSALAG